MASARPKPDRGFFGWFRSLSLQNKLLVALIPSLVAILLSTGWLTYRLSTRFTQIGLERSARLQALAMAHEVESFLDGCRQKLLFIAQGPRDSQGLCDYLARNKASDGPQLRELAFLSPERSGHIFLITEGDKVYQVPEDMLTAIQPSPFLHFTEASDLKLGEVLVYPVEETEYPFPMADNDNLRISRPVVRLATPVEVGDQGQLGLMVLAVDATAIRNILSLFNSTKSPLYAFPRTEELRYAFLLDTDGWIDFQSEPVDKPGVELSTLTARTGYEGTLGKPGLAGAFRPSSVYTLYWRMVSDLRDGHHDCLTLDDDVSNRVDTYFLAYAPVRFQGQVSGHGKDVRGSVFGGVAFVDRSQLTVVAGYRHLDAMFLITLCTVGVMALLVFGLSRMITRPIFRLARAVRDMDPADPREVSMQSSGFETNLLQHAVNTLVARLRDQVEEIRRKDRLLRSASLQERASLEDDPSLLGDGQDSLPEIIGSGPKLAQMKSDILKAARVDVDVLIVGETGTGKQLAAEAIHNHSARAGKPFISINCGALDENLLLDTLFGHTKGAFTEARGERKGAFLEADGGTLFLDEIQAASLKVQQALLRAIAMRKIKPLGSDKELDVNVRLIAATNADLPRMIERKAFREDLYFRLKVITIQAPPLREHTESIPALALHYLRQAEALADKSGLGFSRGAVEKMRAYDWPGNIRELVNCITRAVVMAEDELIQAGDILLEEGMLTGQMSQTWTIPDQAQDAAQGGARGRSGDAGGDSDSGRGEPWDGEAGRETGQARERTRESSSDRRPGQPSGQGPGPQFDRTSGQDGDPLAKDRSQAVESAPNKPSGAYIPAGVPMNERQRAAYPRLAAQGSISRSEYQESVGGDLPSRTAIYDLNDLVRKGLVEKVGSGPATRYSLKGR